VTGFLERSESFLFSFALSLFLGLVISRLAYEHKFLDIPFERKSHSSPVALGGGVTLFLSLFLTSMIMGNHYDLLSCASLIVFVGLVDDMFDLPPGVKLLFQVILALFWIYRNPISLYGSPILGGAFGILWIVAITNAFNLIDGIDGLASGVALISTLGLIFEGVDYASILLGAVLGFFILNYPPARIFLGDAGSYLLGSLIGILTLSAIGDFSISSMFKASLMVSFPLIDLLWTILRRWVKGKPITLADDQHIHHLLKKRFGGKKALLFLLLLHGVFVSIGVWCL